MIGNNSDIVEANLAYNILDDCQDVNVPPNHGDTHASGKDTSSDISRTSVYPTPTYHFHGLGNTQTQSESQADSDFYDFNDGSQKENISAPEAIVEPKITLIQASSPAATSVNGIEARGIMGPYAGSPPEMTKTRGTTFKSPRAATIPGHATPNRRSLALAPPITSRSASTPSPRKSRKVVQEDSFLAALPDIGAWYIQPQSKTSATPALRESERMFATRPTAYASSSPERVAKVLVEATPSLSGGSRSPSQQSQHSQDSSQRSEDSSDEFPVGAQLRPEDEDEDMYEDVNEELFRTRNLNADMDIDLPPVADSLRASPSLYDTSVDWAAQLEEQTQPATQIATQSSTQVHDSLVLDTVATCGSSVAMDPRLYNKIRLVVQSTGREKCRRYLARMDIPGLDLDNFDPGDYKSSIPPSTLNPIMSSDVSPMEDIVKTQPSNEDEEQICRRAAMLANPQGKLFRISAENDSMDVVPDSEPQVEYRPSPKVPTPILRMKVTAKDDFSEVVPDSLAVDLTKVPLAETRIDLRREEVEEEDPSDDVPLALKSVIKDKGKGRADITPAPKRPSNPTHETLTPPATVTPAARARGKFKAGSHFSYKEGEVPSSILGGMTASTEPHTTRNKGKGRSVELQSTRRTRNRRGLRKHDYSELSDDEMDVDETKPKVEPDDSLLPSTSNRKRKRGDTDLPRAVSQSSRCGDSSRSKRSRSEVSTATRSGFNPGDRVFADHDNLCYPATFEEEVGEDLWVRFDGESKSIRSKLVRSFSELRPGDRATVVDPTIENVLNGGNVRTIFEDRESVEFVDDQGEVREVAMAMLRISPTVLKSSWNERAVGIFSGYGFILSCSEDQSKRDYFSSHIKSAGGKVIADWTNALELDGTHATTNKWVIKDCDAKWKLSAVERVFLLADQHSEKPKYLFALALGVPCVRLRWIEESLEANEVLDWSSQLLEAGRHRFDGPLVSQMVNLEWGTDQCVKMEDIMQNPVAMKVLGGKRVICYSEEFFPPKQTRSDREKERKALTFCPLIMLAMGAEHVEAHRKNSRCQLSNDALRLADYVVYKDQKPTDPNLKGLTNLVDWQWVKQCLIAGKILERIV